MMFILSQQHVWIHCCWYLLTTFKAELKVNLVSILNNLILFIGIVWTHAGMNLDLSSFILNTFGLRDFDAAAT